ncbi:MAG: hypothetical protein JWP92_3724 [Caulobacter sp.]|nr:hypothetical protein [Caulobacter sp.]
MTEESAAGGAETDLFGDPWTAPRDPRGRKRHKRLPQIAEKVAVLRATGATEEEIALRVGLCDKTLRKYYFRELTEGPALARAMVDEVMYRKAMGGNVSAARYIKERFEKGDASLADVRARARALRPASPNATTRPAPVGKKAERQEAAERVAEAGGRYAVPPAPKLVVDNK